MVSDGFCTPMGEVATAERASAIYCGNNQSEVVKTTQEHVNFRIEYTQLWTFFHCNSSSGNLGGLLRRTEAAVKRWRYKDNIWNMCVCVCYGKIMLTIMRLLNIIEEQLVSVEVPDKVAGEMLRLPTRYPAALRVFLPPLFKWVNYWLQFSYRISV